MRWSGTAVKGPIPGVLIRRHRAQELSVAHTRTEAITTNPKSQMTVVASNAQGQKIETINNATGSGSPGDAGGALNGHKPLADFIGSEMKFLISPSSTVEEIGEATDAYLQYLHRNREKFSRSLFEYLSADWHYDFRDHRCPHDALVVAYSVALNPSIANRAIDMARINLINAYQDYQIEFIYRDIKSLEITPEISCWSYDEVVLCPSGMRHEIVFEEGNAWTIEAAAIEIEIRPARDRQ